jgi:hypothetical protein
MPVNATMEIRQLGVPAIRRRIAGHDTRQRRLIWDAALPAGFDLAGAASGAKPITIRRLGFALLVLVDNRLVEVFDKLSLPLTTDPINSPVNDRSRYIRPERLNTAGAVPYPWPDPTLPLLRSGVATLQGGRDGIAMLRETDVIGDDSLPERRGLRVFELVDEPAALAIPDALIEPTPPTEYDPPPVEEPDPCALEPEPEPPAAPPAPPPVESAPDFGLSVVEALLC